MTRRIAIFISFFCLLSIVFASSFSSAAQTTQSDFQSARSEISTAYVQIYKIEHDGGNASSLTATLDQAIALYNKAELENASNPSQAVLDLQQATQIASSVSSQALPIVHNAESLNEQRILTMSGEIAITLAIAVLVYIYGDRVYDYVWLSQRKDHVVKRNNE